MKCLVIVNWPLCNFFSSVKTAKSETSCLLLTNPVPPLYVNTLPRFLSVFQGSSLCCFLFFKHFSSPRLFGSVSRHRALWNQVTNPVPTWPVQRRVLLSAPSESSVLIGQSGQGYQRVSFLLYCLSRGKGEFWVTDQTLYNRDCCWNIEQFYTYFNKKITLCLVGDVIRVQCYRVRRLLENRQLAKSDL